MDKRNLNYLVSTMGWYITQRIYKKVSLFINSVISEWCSVAKTEQFCGQPQRQFIVFEVLFCFVVRNFMFYLISFRVYYVKTLMRICLHSQWHQFSLGKFGQCFVCQQPVAGRAAKTWATQRLLKIKQNFQNIWERKKFAPGGRHGHCFSQFSMAFLLIRVACIHSAPFTN